MAQDSLKKPGPADAANPHMSGLNGKTSKNTGEVIMARIIPAGKDKFMLIDKRQMPDGSFRVYFAKGRNAVASILHDWDRDWHRMTNRILADRQEASL